MKSRLLDETGGLRTYAVILDKGDDPAAELSRFATENRITGASLSAVGAVERVTLGYFDRDVNDYVDTTFDEQLEVVSLLGDIAEKDGEPALHAHIVLGRRDSSAIGGHLRGGRVFPTLEVIVTETPAHLRKKVDPETGLALITL